MVNKQNAIDGIAQTETIVWIFFYLVGAISLTITFFLLLVSTSQNIRDNIWEYGVLRSIGVTLSEGSRVYMYEAFIVVISAGICGIIIGLISARSLAS